MTEPRREPQTEDEAQELKRYLERGAATSLEVVRRFPSARLPDVLTQPVAVPFDVRGADLLGELTKDEDLVLLDIEVTNVSSSSDPPVLVFVNSPAAGARTPATDPGFVAALAFFCHSQEQGGRFVCVMPQGGRFRFRVDATKAVRKAGTALVPLTVNIVPVPFQGGETQAALRLAKAEIQLVRSTVQNPA
jgi:hypothetical protein